MASVAPTSSADVILTRSERIAVAAAVAATGAVCGLGLAHVLEIPGKHRLDSNSFLAVHHHLYGGYAIVGGLGEAGGLIALSALYVRLRRRNRAAARRLGIAAVIVGGTLVAYAVGLRPLNTEIASWDPATIPSDWTTIRDRWELWHTITFVLSGIALTLTTRTWHRLLRLNAARRDATSTPSQVTLMSE